MLDASARAEVAALTPLTVDAATTFDVDLQPVRVTANRGVTLEADAEYSQLGELVADDAMSALDDQLEALIVNGDGTAPNWTGLYSRAGAAHAGESSEDSYATVVGYLDALIDGVYGATLRDVRAIMPADLWAWAATKSPASGLAGESNLADWMVQNLDGVAVSAHAPAKASSKAKILCRVGMVPKAYAYPLWSQRLVFDDVTAAGVGRKVFAAVLANFHVPQKAAKAGKRDDFRTVELNIG